MNMVQTYVSFNDVYYYLFIRNYEYFNNAQANSAL